MLRSSYVLIAVVGPVLLAACGSSVAGTSTPSASPTPSSTAALQQVDGLAIDTTSDRGSMAAIVSGVAGIDPQGCWMLATTGELPHAIVWPLGTRWTDAQHTAVVVDSGVVVRNGQRITAGGGYVDRVPRAQTSIAPDVRCLSGDPVSFVVVNPDVKPAS